MNLSELAEILSQKLDTGEALTVGGIDAAYARCMSVLPGDPPAKAHLCVGGTPQTLTGVLTARILIHWGWSMAEAEAKANEVWRLFLAMPPTERICYADPGGGPKFLGRGARGVCEFEVTVKLIYKE